MNSNFVSIFVRFLYILKNQLHSHTALAATKL